MGGGEIGHWSTSRYFQDDSSITPFSSSGFDSFDLRCSWQLAAYSAVRERTISKLTLQVEDTRPPFAALVDIPANDAAEADVEPDGDRVVLEAAHEGSDPESESESEMAPEQWWEEVKEGSVRYEIKEVSLTAAPA